jgi:hypothetical protein
MCYSRAPRKPRTELPPFLICHCGLRLRTAFLRRPPFYREGPAGPTPDPTSSTPRVQWPMAA